MTSNIGILIVDKVGDIRPLCVKSYDEAELYKRCGYKVNTNFNKQGEFQINSNDLTYIVSVYGKDSGNANNENKYEFPPPLDNILLFGKCALVLHTLYKNETTEPILETLDVELWEKLYEKLFGGFEDLTANMSADEEESDELDNISDSYKTKNGYLKDGFIVDDSDTITELSSNDLSNESELSEEEYLLEET